MKARTTPKSTKSRPRAGGKRAKPRQPRAAQALNSISVYDAKAGFSKLLDRVADGQEVVITRHGTPVARILRMESDAELIARREQAVARLLRRRVKLEGITIMDLVREAREGRR